MNNTQKKYDNYLITEKWIDKKNRKLKENPYCQLCWEKANTVHHLSYDRLWEELDSDFVSICNTCHHKCHYINWYQIKNTEKDLKTRYNELISVFWIPSCNKEIDNSFFRNEALKTIWKDPWLLEEFPYWFLLDNLWEKIKKDKKFMLELLMYWPYSWRQNLFDYIPNKYKTNREFILELAKKWYFILDKIWKEFLSDREIILEFVKNSNSFHFDFLSEISDILKNDREIFTFVAKSTNSGYIKYASEEIRSDKKIALQAICSWWYVLECLSDDLKNDKEIVVKAIDKNPFSFKFVSDLLKWDKSLALYAINKNRKNIEYISDKLKDDPEILLCAASIKWYYEGYNFCNAVKFMSKRFHHITYENLKKNLWKPEDSYWGISLFIYKLFH